MRYLLDTNVLSEFISVRPDAAVVGWLGTVAAGALAISALSVGEAEFGLVLLPEGARRRRLTTWLHHDIPRLFAGRVLDVNSDIALAWGRLTAAGKRAGRPLPPIDDLLLATAQLHGLTLVTRNVSDCGGRGVPTLDPWQWAGAAPPDATDR